MIRPSQTLRLFHISWVLVRAFSGRIRGISPLLWIVTAGFVIYFARGPIEALLH